MRRMLDCAGETRRMLPHYETGCGEGVMHYLHWAKVHSTARYELTGSGVPPARRADLGGGPPPVSLEAEGAYGDPELIEAISKLYGIAPESVVPVPGASSANFIALATAVEHGACVMVECPAYDPLQRVSRFLGLKIIPIERRACVGFDVSLDEIESGVRQPVFRRWLVQHGFAACLR